jgi:ribosomal protein RSM22 (predicted rRNA methylase)
VKLPGDLDAAIEAWMAAHGRGGLAMSAQQLSAAYRKGETSSRVNLAAYVATRVPATFEANREVQKALAAAMPGFAPRTLLDIGAGPGVASWAAVQAWNSIEKVTQCEQDQNFAGLAADLNRGSEVDALTEAAIVLASEATLPTDISADLVTVSYMLAEMPLPLMPQIAKRLWARATQVLILIEPGTPQGFARLKVARETLMEQGAHVLAPCTHQNGCPMTPNDWCHFKTRVQRSREHMHAKQATVPFEDEPFSYLVVSRQAALQKGGRIVAPVESSKPGVLLHLCDASGLRDVTIASRDKPTYKRAKKTVWGQVWE